MRLPRFLSRIGNRMMLRNTDREIAIVRLRRR
jgi:hypothetical protein